MSKLKTVFNLTQDGKSIFKGSEDGCYFTLQKSQGQSADHAMKYGGWKVEPMKLPESEANEILSKDQYHYIEVTLLEDLHFMGGNTLLKIKLEDGTEARGNKNAIRYSDSRKGSKVLIMQGYVHR